jgi:hypothetical protein
METKTTIDPKSISEDPKTIGEIKDFLTLCIDKALSLKAVNFAHFTPARLPDDYIYNKWLSKKKDFADVYLNMDGEAQRKFVKWVVGPRENLYTLSAILHRFFLFCWNWDSKDFTENPFEGKHKDLMCMKATGKRNPSWIMSKDVQKLFHKLDNNGKTYLTWCVFGKKKEAAVND